MLFKDRVHEKIKQYSNDEYLDGYIEKEFKIKDGTAEVYINIEDKDELFDSWTIGDQIDLANDVYTYIEEKTAMLGNHIQIRLHITGCNLTSHEQGVIKHVLKEHFAIELYKIQKEYDKNKKKILALVLVGILSLLCYLLIYLFGDYQFFLTFFSFIFTFALWEAMDALIYNFSDIKYKREAITQNLLMDLEFDGKDKKR